MSNFAPIYADCLNQSSFLTKVLTSNYSALDFTLNGLCPALKKITINRIDLDLAYQIVCPTSHLYLLTASTSLHSVQGTHSHKVLTPIPNLIAHHFTIKSHPLLDFLGGGSVLHSNPHHILPCHRITKLDLNFSLKICENRLFIAKLDTVT